MVSRIPVYEQRGVIGGVQSEPRASSAVNANSPIAAGLGNLAQGLGNVAAVVRQKEEDESLQDVANVLSQGNVFWQQQQYERQQAWKPGDPDLRETIGTEFDKWKSENSGKIASPGARKFFEQRTLQMKEALLTNAYAATQKKITDKLNADTIAGMDADEQAVFANPASMMQVYQTRMETMIGRNDIDETTKIRDGLAFKQRLALAAQMGQVAQDPEGWYMQQFGGLPEAVGGTVKPGTQVEGGALAIANAIYGQESSYGKADTSKVNSQNVTGPMQMQEATFNRAKEMGLVPANYDWKNPTHNKEAGFAWVNYLHDKYKGDAAKVAAAYYGGEGAVAEDGTIKRHWRNKQRPQDPTVGEYVDQVLGRVNGGNQQQAKATSFASLPWQQQMKLRSEAEQQIKIKAEKQFATATIEAATLAVNAQEIGVDGAVDDAQAVSDAVQEIQARTGRLPDPTQLQVIEGQVARAARLREAQRKTEQDNIKGSLIEVLEQNGGDYVGLMASNAADLAKLPRDMQTQLQSFAGDVATGANIPTDWVVVAPLLDNPELLMQTNLSAIRDRIGKKEYTQLVKMQAQARKEKEEGRPQTIQSDMAVVKSLLDKAGITDKKKHDAFFFALQDDMDAKMQATGKTKLSQEEVRDLAEGLLVKKITDKGMIWDTTKRVYEMTMDDIPKSEIARIRAALPKAGIPVNDSTILRAYMNSLEDKT